MEEVRIYQIEERLQFIAIELIHSPYLDGWYIQGLKEEKKNLEIELISLINDKIS